jgi:hypothetical protein
MNFAVGHDLSDLPTEKSSKPLKITQFIFKKIATIVFTK